MADKKVQIKIDTTANTKGAQDASKALDKVNESQKEVARSAGQAQSNTDALERELTATADKARVSEFAFYNLDESIARTGNTSQAVANGGLKQVGNGFKNVGTTIGQVGFQVQDFAVQVGGGTSALTAFAQQGSQLLGIFGPGGAVAGALLAIGAIGVRAFSSMREEATKFNIDVETAANNAASNAADSFQESLDAINQSIEQAAALSQGYDQTRESAVRYATSSLENSEKIRQAEQLIAEALGRQVNLRAQLAAQQEEDAQKRAIQAQAEIDSQNRRLELAQQELSRLQTKGEKFDSLRADVLFELNASIQRLESIRAERRELEELAKFDFSSNMFDSEISPDMATARRATQARDAQRRLADPAEAEARALQESGLSGLIDQFRAQLNTLDGTIAGVGTEIAQANTNLQDTAGSVSTEIARIQEAAGTSEILAQAQAATALTKQTGDQAIAELQQILSVAEPANASQKQARDLIAQAIADSRVTAQEATTIAANLPILAQSISATNQQSLTQVNTLINLMGILRQNQVETDRKIQDLSRQIGKPTN